MNESRRLYNILHKRFPEKVDEILSQDRCDIGPDFLGFVETYRYLAKIIPTHFRIIDIGCAYAFQSYYFRNHDSYIGIDPFRVKTFRIGDFSYFSGGPLKVLLHAIEVNDTDFCICNYVPCNSADSLMIREKFPNLYCFYPKEDPKETKRIANIMRKSKAPS